MPSELRQFFHGLRMGLVCLLLGRKFKTYLMHESEDGEIDGIAVGYYAELTKEKDAAQKRMSRDGPIFL